jgi:hypothetical protein
MDKQAFINAIEAIEDQIEIDRQMHKAFEIILPDTYVGSIKNVLYDAMIDLLVSMTNDKDGWIKYYLWDLDCGNENHRLKVYDKNENEIPLRNAEDLWSLIYGM